MEPALSWPALACRGALLLVGPCPALPAMLCLPRPCPVCVVWPRPALGCLLPGPTLHGLAVWLAPLCCKSTSQWPVAICYHTFPP